MKKAIIVDIDGTLANCDHRRVHLEGDKPNWPKFYEGMGNDTINVWCQEIINQLSSCGYEILLVTGRPQEYENITKSWIGDGDEIWCDALFMRKTGDYRQDAIVKKEIYEEYIKPHYEVLFVIDDRKQVVDMWREQGLVCLHCAEGNF